MSRSFACFALLVAACAQPPPAVAPAPPPPAEAPPAPAAKEVALDPPADEAPRDEPAALSPEAIRDVVGASSSDLRACYLHGRGYDRKLAGRVSVKFTIAPAGDVEGAELEEATTLRNARVTRCMLDVYGQMKFPRSVGKVTIVYPIDFSAE
jgi:hypothetical protein